MKSPPDASPVIVYFGSLDLVCPGVNVNFPARNFRTIVLAWAGCRCMSPENSPSFCRMTCAPRHARPAEPEGKT